MRVIGDLYPVTVCAAPDGIAVTVRADQDDEVGHYAAGGAVRCTPSTAPSNLRISHTPVVQATPARNATRSTKQTSSQVIEVTMHLAYHLAASRRTNIAGG